jgi:hypothetical protein
MTRNQQAKHQAKGIVLLKATAKGMVHNAGQNLETSRHGLKASVTSAWKVGR